MARRARTTPENRLRHERGARERRVARWGIASIAAALSSAALGQVLGTGCSGNAVDVDGCRSIEQARCEAMLGCPDSPIQDQADVDACKLFYRDQCLFGMATENPPDDATLTGCLNAIAQAGACKATAIHSCSGAPALVASVNPRTTSGCGAVQAPELLLACTFLGPIADAGAGGSGAWGGGGSGGAGGTHTGGGGTGGGGAGGGGAGGAAGGNAGSGG